MAGTKVSVHIRHKTILENELIDNTMPGCVAALTFLCRVSSCFYHSSLNTALYSLFLVTPMCPISSLTSRYNINNVTFAWARHRLHALESARHWPGHTPAVPILGLLRNARKTLNNSSLIKSIHHPSSAIAQDGECSVDSDA